MGQTICFGPSCNINQRSEFWTRTKFKSYCKLFAAKALEITDDHLRKMHFWKCFLAPERLGRRGSFNLISFSGNDLGQMMPNHITSIGVQLVPYTDSFNPIRVYHHSITSEQSWQPERLLGLQCRETTFEQKKKRVLVGCNVFLNRNCSKLTRSALLSLRSPWISLRRQKGSHILTCYPYPNCHLLPVAFVAKTHEPSNIDDNLIATSNLPSAYCSQISETTWSCLVPVYNLHLHRFISDLMGLFDLSIKSTSFEHRLQFVQELSLEIISSLKNVYVVTHFQQSFFSFLVILLSWIKCNTLRLNSNSNSIVCAWIVYSQLICI